MSVETQAQIIRNVNGHLFEASKRGDVERVQMYMSHPNALTGTAVQKAAKAGHMHIVEILMNNGAEKRFVFHAMLLLLDGRCVDVEIFAKILNSEFWEKSSENMATLVKSVILRDNLEIFKLFDDKFLADLHQNAVYAAEKFSTKILSHILDNHVFGTEQLNKLVDSLVYGYMATYKKAFSTPRGKYSKYLKFEQEKIIDVNYPIYDELIKRIAVLLDDVPPTPELLDLMTMFAFDKAGARIHQENQKLREHCWI